MQSQERFLSQAEVSDANKPRQKPEQRNPCLHRESFTELAGTHISLLIVIEVMTLFNVRNQSGFLWLPPQPLLSQRA